jgi:hypothetical protein
MENIIEASKNVISPVISIIGLPFVIIGLIILSIDINLNRV